MDSNISEMDFNGEMQDLYKEVARFSETTGYFYGAILAAINSVNPTYDIQKMNISKFYEEAQNEGTIQEAYDKLEETLKEITEISVISRVETIIERMETYRNLLSDFGEWIDTKNASQDSKFFYEDMCNEMETLERII